MSEKDKHTELPEAQKPAETAQAVPNSDGSGEETTPEQLIEALMGENTDLKDKLMRTLAEMENLRRRTEKEKTDTSKYAISSLAKDLLGIGDNLKRALECVPLENRNSHQEETKHLIEGVELTQKELHNVLNRHQINIIEAQGQKFDPNLHQAMFEVPNPDVASGTVLEVVQDGYTIGDRVLRPAMVGVSKGGNKPAPETESSPEAKKAAETLEETAQKQADAKTSHNVDKSA